MSRDTEHSTRPFFDGPDLSRAAIDARKAWWQGDRTGHYPGCRCGVCQHRRRYAAGPPVAEGA